MPGAVEALQLQDIIEPETQNGYVKIRTRAFGLDRAETYYLAGNYGGINEPGVPGIEAVGEVIEDKSGMFQTGQIVVAEMGGLKFARHGSYAENNEMTPLLSKTYEFYQINEAQNIWEVISH